MTLSSRLAPLTRAVLRTQSDERLVALTREGREPAFEEIVRRYRPGLVAFAAAYAPPDRAEDVVQESLVRSWQALGSSAEEIHLKPWLYTIVRNRALNARRDARVSEPLRDDVDGVAQPPEIVLGREELGAVVGAVSALPEAQRQALIRSSVEGHTHEQIAAAIGATPGAVRQLIYRARVNLRTAVGALIPLTMVRLLTEHGLETATAAGGLAAGGAAIGGAGGVSAAGKLATVAAIGTLAAGAGVAIERSGEGNGGRDAAAAQRAVGSEAGALPRSDTGEGASFDSRATGSTGASGGSGSEGTAGGEDAKRGDDRGSGESSSPSASSGSDEREREDRDDEDEDRSGPGPSGDDDEPEVDEDHSGPGGGGSGPSGSGSGSGHSGSGDSRDDTGSGGSSSGSGSDDDFDDPLEEPELEEGDSGPGSSSSGSGSSGSDSDDLLDD